MSKLDLSLSIKARDYASAVVKKLTDNVAKSSKDIENNAKKTAKTEQAEVKKTAKITEQSYKKTAKLARTTFESREQLGIRSERAIQNEINRTRRSYDQLKNSGLASSRELSRAYNSMQSKVKELNAEMGKVSKGQMFDNVAKGIGRIATGVTAGAMMMREPAKKQMTFDRQLAMTANTAFAERDVEGRIAGKKELFNAVQNAVEVGGGSKEDALSALDTLLASGTVKADTAMKLLPTLQKGAIATGSSTEDLSRIAISAMQQFGIKEDDIGRVLDMAVAAGQAGNFELSDMARWLPQQMAVAKGAGLSGLKGFESLLVANQQARVTAGTSDQAGNNLANLLGKITSKETNERFKNLKIKKNGKEVGIDFLKSMEDYKSQGQDSLQAFMSIMDDVVGNNDKYKELQSKLKNAKGTGEQQEILTQMRDLVEGTAIGSVISDKEALLALVGMRNNVALGKEVKEQVQNSDGAVEKSHEVIKSTNDFKTEQLNNTVEFAQMKNFEKVNNVMGDLSESLAEYAKEYPNLTQSLVGAKDAVIAFGTALAASSVFDMLSGGKGGGLLKSTIKKVTPAGLGSTAAKFGKNVMSKTSSATKTALNMGKQIIPKTSSVVKSAVNVGKNVMPSASSLLKGGIIFEAATHATELNKGEDEFLLKMKKDQKYYSDTPKELSDDYHPEATKPLQRQHVNPNDVRSLLFNTDDSRNIQFSNNAPVKSITDDLSSLSAVLGEEFKKIQPPEYNIENNIVVELDGSVISEHTVGSIVNQMKRG